MKEQKRKTVKFVVESRNPDGTRRWHVEEWNPSTAPKGASGERRGEKGDKI